MCESKRFGNVRCLIMSKKKLHTKPPRRKHILCNNENATNKTDWEHITGVYLDWYESSLFVVVVVVISHQRLTLFSHMCSSQASLNQSISFFVVTECSCCFVVDCERCFDDEMTVYMYGYKSLFVLLFCRFLFYCSLMSIESNHFHQYKSAAPYFFPFRSIQS